MKQYHQVKTVRLLSRSEQTQGIAILAEKLNFYQVLTDGGYGGYFSEAAQEHYAFAIATPDEHGLQVFKREEVVVCQPQ